MKYFKVVILILFIVLSGCSNIIVDELPKGYYINLQANDIEVYSKTYIKDIIKDTNIDISENKLIKTNKLGENTYNLYFNIKRKSYLYHIKYNVVDTKKPVVLSSSKTVKIGFDKDLCTLISYGDNYDRSMSCTYTNTYDINTKGIYDISYSIKDNSENELIYNMKLNVIDENEISNFNISNTKENFKDIYDNNKTDNTLIGIDVSKWQNDIDFKKVKDSGCEFVFIRIGVQKDKNANIKIDSKFYNNFENAKREDLKIGVYLYSMASSKKEAISQANWVINTLNNEKLSLPIVFDWENFSSWNSYNLNFNDINEISSSFLNTIKKNGYDAMLYSSKFYLENVWNNDKYPIWLAHYTNKTNYNGKYKVWQISNNAIIDGIDEAVDVDIMYK